AFIAHIGLQWWSSWYPGADPGGGGYIAQRMMSAKNEKHSLFATLWFTIAHYTIRPWPWILVALSALVLLPRAQNVEALRQENPALFQRVEQVHQSGGLQNNVVYGPDFLNFYEKYENTVDPGVMYPKLMLRYLPTGLLGLLIAVFLAAYMSTISSQLNWGTSYLINDFYKRFLKKNADEQHYVRVSRLGIVLMVIFSLIVTRLLNTISGAWEFIINASAGMGAVLILRWYWWRINGWSEISAMIAPLIIYPIARFKFGLQSPITLYPVVLGTTIVWLVVTFLTCPTDKEKLHEFYRRVHPGGWGWRKIAAELPEVKSDSGYGRLFIDWLAGVIMVYSALFGIGKLIFAEWLAAVGYLTLGAVGAFIIQRDLSKRSLGFSE
ncbi:MAG: sodium:proline symporter, partial [candidate division KSB1 bacterium]|nr:sodium:proline symporter [candidate division KSB1 bacterium]